VEAREALLMECVQDVLLNETFASPGPHDVESLALFEDQTQVRCAPASSSVVWVRRTFDLFQVDCFVPVNPVSSTFLFGFAQVPEHGLETQQGIFASAFDLSKEKLPSLGIIRDAVGIQSHYERRALNFTGIVKPGLVGLLLAESR